MNTQNRKFKQNSTITGKLYRENELAEILNISPMTLKRIRYAGEIAFLRIGTQVRYNERQLEDYLERCQRKSKG